MTNVIQLTVPSRIEPFRARVTALSNSFATARRVSDDVFWLKENAELLNILECTGQRVPQSALTPYAEFYAQAEKRLRFFPQYYRFFLSMALDLEALGFDGNKAERMVDFCHKNQLVDAEISDLQRAEAQRLMMRVGVSPVRDRHLDDRLRSFANHSDTFVLPNKKAAYELTHIVYYLSEYGRRDPEIGAQALESLQFAGITAFLDQNADLLAEICIALIYAGQKPSPMWTDWLQQQTAAFEVSEDAGSSVSDQYHEYFVCNWHQAVINAPMFRKPLSDGPLRFHRGGRSVNALREISQMMLGMDERRSGDWGYMRHQLEAGLSRDALAVLDMVAQSAPSFDAYFQGFARAGAA